MLFRWRRRQREQLKLLFPRFLCMNSNGSYFCLFLFVRVFVGRAFHLQRVVSVKKPDFLNKRIIKRRDDLRIRRSSRPQLFPPNDARNDRDL
jgi:hypothetical protein